MSPPLTPAQQELLRHCFTYNDCSTHYLSKLSVAEIADFVQCGTRVVYNLRKMWEKTGDVEKIRKRGGREKCDEKDK